MTDTPLETAEPLDVAPMTAAERRRAKARQSARRNSHRVYWLRRLVPALGLVLLVGVAGRIIVERVMGGLPFGIGDLSLTSDGFVMDAPTLAGSDASGRTYSVSAERAIQSLTEPGRIRLENIVAAVELPDGNRAEFTAPKGQFHMQEESLQLSGGLEIKTGRGDTARLETVEVDLKSGAARAPAPVELSSEVGDIRADRFSVSESGQVVRFEGNVRMTIRPDRVEMLKQ